MGFTFKLLVVVVLLLFSSVEETQYEDEEDDDEEEVIINPLNKPPHLGLCLMQSWPPAIFPAPDRRDFDLPSRCDSTLRRVQSPNPVEIRSKKSPEKLRLPQPTDLDLETFRPNETWSGLSFSSTTMTSSFLELLFLDLENDPVFPVLVDDGELICLMSGKFLPERCLLKCLNDQNLFLFWLMSSSSLLKHMPRRGVAVDLLLLKIMALFE